MNKKALTLLEIIVSTVILALVVTGLANVFVASKGFIQHSRFRMSAGEAAKKFIDPLQAYVRQDSWETGCFNTGNINDCPDVPTNTGAYNTAYTISSHPTDSDIKKVKVVINWAEWNE